MNICLQEAFQFQFAGGPSQTSIRCLCKRSGCNVPMPFVQFVEGNKKVIAITTQSIVVFFKYILKMIRHILQK
ncbi:unnamed protein product [Caenorhabditis nigoni]